MRIIILAAAFALAGCMNTPTLNTVEYACAASTAALKTIIVFNDKLTPANRTAVQTATQTINPVCSQATLPTLDSTAKAALDGALAQLSTAATQVSQ